MECLIDAVGIDEQPLGDTMSLVSQLWFQSRKVALFRASLGSFSSSYSDNRVYAVSQYDKRRKQVWILNDIVKIYYYDMDMYLFIRCISMDTMGMKLGWSEKKKKKKKGAWRSDMI